MNQNEALPPFECNSKYDEIFSQMDWKAKLYDIIDLAQKELEEATAEGILLDKADRQLKKNLRDVC